MQHQPTLEKLKVGKFSTNTFNNLYENIGEILEK
jgi:hypothetical protein